MKGQKWTKKIDVIEFLSSISTVMPLAGVQCTVGFSPPGIWEFSLPFSNQEGRLLLAHPDLKT